MKLDLSELSYEAKWYEFGDCKLFIRPLPNTMSSVTIRDGELIIEGRERFASFNHCLVDWKNVVDENGKDLPCTEEVKRKVFDFGLGGISGFVLDQAGSFQERKADQEKN